MIDLSISIYAFISILATTVNFVHAVFVLLKNPRSQINRLWCLAAMCLVVWGCGEIIMRTTTEVAQASIANRLGGIGFRLLPSFFLHFTLVFTDKRNFLRH